MDNEETEEIKNIEETPPITNAIENDGQSYHARQIIDLLVLQNGKLETEISQVRAEIERLKINA
ncbi:hypothetical protein ACI1UN_02125 [Lactococcus petauri]|uniref:hypothetical protein n=1 Tax=Lactococcus petauri TaxID=1940789 RepID=UPI00385233FE